MPLDRKAPSATAVLQWTQHPHASLADTQLSFSTSLSTSGTVRMAPPHTLSMQPLQLTLLGLLAASVWLLPRSTT
jgi:hypothetical protein